jgi:hypothetical protein
MESLIQFIIMFLDAARSHSKLIFLNEFSCWPTCGSFSIQGLALSFDFFGAG